MRGSSGQFDVVVDGEVVASRNAAGFPDEDDVVAARAPPRP